MLNYLALIPFYFIGAFPTGKLVSALYGVDIEDEGSGNVGATNVARVIGKKAGVLTLLGDVVKGALAGIVALLCFRDPLLQSLAGSVTVAGHCFSIPGKLKGGKGVATSLGVLLALHPLSALVAVAVFAICAGAWKIVSVASIAAAVMVPVFQLLTNASDATVFPTMILTAIIVFRHKENLVRLIEGREPRFKSPN